MTRLITDWVKDIAPGMREYNDRLERLMGMDLQGLSAFSCNLDRHEFRGRVKKRKAAVVPITSGLGIIGGFAQSVSAILASVGLDTFVTEKADVDGLYEAKIEKADMIFTADDNRFIALDVKSGNMVENDYATALGYISALEMMAGPLKDKRILLMGYGRVGKIALGLLIGRKVEVVVYDKDRGKVCQAGGQGASILRDEGQIKEFSYILDMTDEGGWITPEMLAEDVWIASPGVPFSLDERAAEKYEGRVLHDRLQIGTAVMLALLIR